MLRLSGPKGSSESLGGDLRWDKEQRSVDVAVGMSIAEGAEVLETVSVISPVSTLLPMGLQRSRVSGTIIMLRTANSLMLK